MIGPQDSFFVHTNEVFGFSRVRCINFFLPMGFLLHLLFLFLCSILDVFGETILDVFLFVSVAGWGVFLSVVICLALSLLGAIEHLCSSHSSSSSISFRAGLASK